jgi:uncharacterized membrane protein YedE/YeeE
VFGIGMQLANGCGSGTLYTAGGGSGRMLITLALFIVGSVIGSLHLPAFLALGGVDPILASDYLGPWGGLVATLASVAAAAVVIAAYARARGASLLGADFSGAAFWQWPGPKRALAESILSDTSSLTDLGMILGAMAAAAATRPFARTAWPPARSLIAAAIGGLLMGWGARIGFGCNIGAFVGGVASGSLHGWIWFAAALGGCMIGIRLRPLFGLSRE